MEQVVAISYGALGHMRMVPSLKPEKLVTDGGAPMTGLEPFISAA